MISPFGIRDGTSFEIVFPVLNHINVAPNYFRIYSDTKEKVMFIVLEELTGTLSHLPLPGQYLIADAHSPLGAHDFKVSEYLIERKWCFSPFFNSAYVVYTKTIFHLSVGGNAYLVIAVLRHQFFALFLFAWLRDFYAQYRIRKEILRNHLKDMEVTCKRQRIKVSNFFLIWVSS